MPPTRFRVIRRRLPFSREQLRMLISRPYWELSFYNFRAQPLQYSLFGLNMLPVQFRAILRRQSFSLAWPFPIFVIWHKYATCAISRDSEMATFSHEQSHMLISRPSRERSFYNFHARPLPKFIFWPKYAAHAISQDAQTASFFE